MSKTIPRLSGTMYLKPVMLAICFQAANPSQVFAQTIPAQTSSRQSPAKPQVYTREGISVEFSAAPISSGEGKAAELLAGTEAQIRFKVVDANVGKALGNLRPAAIGARGA